MTPLQVQSNSANLATETTLASVLTSTNFAAAFGTAGTADSQVMSVQGIASMTPLLVTPRDAAAAPIFGTAEALADNVSTPTLGGIRAYWYCWDATGSNWDRCQVGQDGSHGSSVAAGGPRMIGEASNTVSGDTDVSDAQDTRLKAGVDGVLISRPYAPKEDTIGQAVIDISSGSTTEAIAALGSGIRAYVVTAVCSNTSGSDTEVEIEDGSGGTPKTTFPCPSPGSTVRFEPPLRFTANTAVHLDAAAALSTLKVTLSGFRGK